MLSPRGLQPELAMDAASPSYPGSEFGGRRQEKGADPFGAVMMPLCPFTPPTTPQAGSSESRPQSFPHTQSYRWPQTSKGREWATLGRPMVEHSNSCRWSPEGSNRLIDLAALTNFGTPEGIGDEGLPESPGTPEMWMRVVEGSSIEFQDGAESPTASTEMAVPSLTPTLPSTNRKSSQPPVGLLRSSRGSPSFPSPLSPLSPLAPSPPSTNQDGTPAVHFLAYPRHSESRRWSTTTLNSMGVLEEGEEGGNSTETPGKEQNRENALPGRLARWASPSAESRGESPYTFGRPGRHLVPLSSSLPEGWTLSSVFTATPPAKPSGLALRGIGMEGRGDSFALTRGLEAKLRLLSAQRELQALKCQTFLQSLEADKARGLLHRDSAAATKSPNQQAHGMPKGGGRPPRRTNSELSLRRLEAESATGSTQSLGNATSPSVTRAATAVHHGQPRGSSRVMPSSPRNGDICRPPTEDRRSATARPARSYERHGRTGLRTTSPHSSFHQQRDHVDQPLFLQSQSMRYHSSSLSPDNRGL